MSTFVEGAHSTKWIAIKHLSVVWATAQREFNDRHANKIAASFDPDLFDDLVVTLPNGDGIYHVVDGQHRMAAIRSLWGEEEKVPCRIVDAKDPARAASIFDKINTGRRLPTGIEKFRVRVTAGSETEVAINKVVAFMGLRVEHNDGPNSIRAVAALMNVHNSFGLEVLKESLMTIRGTWKDDKGAWEGPIIEGYGSLIGEHRGHLEWPRLREKTASTYTPGRLLGAAKADKETLGGRISDGVRRVLIRNYNQGLRTGKLGG
jgi:hypothetical protein